MTADVSHDPYDVRFAVAATGTLATFNRVGVLSAADVHVAARLGRLCGEADERVQLAAALAVRSVRLGSVCIDLARVQRTVGAEGEEAVDLAALLWPAAPDWLAACRRSPMVAVGVDGPVNRPLRLVDGLLYLDRYWRQEQLVRAELGTRAARPAPAVDRDTLRDALDRLFPGDGADAQRLAAAAVATGWVTIVAGGPGTGKTTTVARLLAVLGEVLEPPPRVALAAPTGKAAARLQEAVAEASAELESQGLPFPAALPASTLHRLLGWRPDSRGRFRHDRSNRLPYDVVVVDETSMVSLTLMSRLLEALRPDARLVLVGDPDQLASVEAGAVLGDLVGRDPGPGPDARSGLLAELVPVDLAAPEVRAELRNGVVRLTRTWRFGGTIGELATAIRRGDDDAVIALLRSGAGDVEFLESDSLADRMPVGLEGLRRDVVEAGSALVEAARSGEAGLALGRLEAHRQLCAHRRGPYGVARWSDEVERWLKAAIDGYGEGGEWYLGRPLIATANDYETRLYNGDSGVVVVRPDGAPAAAFGRGTEPLIVAVTRLSTVQTAHALTVHRAQGSQFERVSVLLPPEESPLLTRELLYTAVTRAREAVRVIGSEAAVRLAVQRPIVRASGLRIRSP